MTLTKGVRDKMDDFKMFIVYMVILFVIFIGTSTYLIIKLSIDSSKAKTICEDNGYMKESYHYRADYLVADCIKLVNNELVGKQFVVGGER